MNRKKIIFSAAAAVITMICTGVSAQTTDVYFIGNSFTYTYNVPATFRDLSAAGGHETKTGSDLVGGSELADHWLTGVATNAIVTGSYDYVILQENSGLSYTPSIQSNFDIYAPLYNDIIINNGAKPLLYMTWVRESQLAYLQDCIDIYRNMASQLGCGISPVGEAWKRLLNQYPSIDPYGSDRHHPGPEGAYLSACCLYGAVYGESPEGLAVASAGGTAFDAADAAVLERIAWDAVQFVSFTNPPVITSLTVDQAVRTNSAPFTFVATATDNGSIVDYLWDFGDGTVTNGSSLANAVHNYTNDGIFPVTVKVTDNSGETDRAGLTVTRDTTGPQISTIAAASEMLTVRFSQDIQQAGAETAANYAISGGVGASVVSATQVTSNVVRLRVSPLAPGVEYTLTVNDLYNSLGMKIYPNTFKTFMYVDSSGMHLLFDFGSTNYPTEGNWNNITYNGGDLVISNAVDIYGVSRNIGLRCVPATAITYSTGGGYGPTASNLYPATAQKDCLYATRKFSYQIEGADPAGEYRLTFFASKSATNRETLFTVGASNAVLDCAYNSNRVAVIERVKSDADGNILFSVDTNTVPYCYISVLELEDTRGEISQLIETDVSAMDIAEGTVSNIMVRLSSQPVSNVTVSVNASGYAHVQVLSESAFLYFATTNWDVWQPVCVEALNDADADNGTAIIQFADVDGVYSSTNVSATQIDDDGIGIAGFTASPTSGWVPLTVSFTDTSTIGGITNRYWDFGDGTTTNTTATNVSHTYSSAGTNTVTLIVRSSAGTGTNTQTGAIIVTAPVAPSASFTASPVSGTAPLPVTFTDTSTGTITNRYWNFGDGKTTNTVATSVAHTYTAAGTNTVTLIVSGPAGASTNVQADIISVASGAAGSLIIYDPFNSPTSTPLVAGWAPPGWTTDGTTANGDRGYIKGGSLSYAGLSASEGNSLGLGAGTDDYMLNFSTISLAVGDTVYFSFIGKYNVIPGSAVTGVGGFIRLANSADALSVTKGICISRGSIGTPAATNAGFAISPNSKTYGFSPAVGTPGTYDMLATYLIVGSYTRGAAATDGMLKLWINPDSATFGTDNPPVPTLSMASASSADTFNQLRIGANGSGSHPTDWQIDEVRVGTSWSVVAPSDSASVSAPVITSALFATGTVGQAFSYQIAADNTPVSFNATGLPSGLSIDTNSGSISGTPVADGSNSVTISASNTGGTDSKTLAVIISPVPIDNNGNGIPDAWETQYGITNSNPTAMAANGINTILESYVAGLNPTNSAERFNVWAQQDASQKLFQWNAASGRVYSVYWTTNLLNGFQPLETNIVWPQNSWTDTVHGAQGGGYYQIKVRMNP